MRKTIITLIHLLIVLSVWSQNAVTGTFTSLSNQQIKLMGYNGFETYAIDSIQTNEKGQFDLSYGTEDFGMAYLLSEDNKSFVVILSENENLQLSGNNFALAESIAIKNGKQNKLFEK